MTATQTPSLCLKIKDGYYSVSMATSIEVSIVSTWFVGSRLSRFDSAAFAAFSLVLRHHSSIESGRSAPAPSIFTVRGSAGTPRTVPWKRDSTPVLLCFFISATIELARTRVVLQDFTYCSSSPPFQADPAARSDLSLLVCRCLLCAGSLCFVRLSPTR